MKACLARITRRSIFRMWEFCSNLNWNTLSSLASLVTAIASLTVVGVSIWAANNINRLTGYANNQTDRSRYEEILKEFLAAGDSFHQSEYKNRTVLKHLNLALLYGEIYTCPEICEHISNIKIKVLEALRNFNKWDRFDIYPDQEHSKEELYNFFMSARDEANGLLENFDPFKKYIKVKNDL